MAEKRMFAKSIVLSDAFLDMPMSARCLYFTLSMLADDDGFVGSPKAIMRQCGSSQDDMAILISKRYVLTFESGVIVIKHWRINNYLRNDRYYPTTYQEELSTLKLDEKGAYTEKNGLGIPSGIPTVYPDKNSIEENRIEENRVEYIADKPQTKRFSKPSIDEIRDYCIERKNSVDPDRFYDYYEANGWKVGKNPMKDWKAAVRTWENNDRGNGKKQTTTFMDIYERRKAQNDSRGNSENPHSNSG